MAEMTLFSFQPGSTLLHQLDVRFKLILMVLLSLSMVNAAFPALAAVSFVFALLAMYLRLSILSAMKELRYFLLLLMVVFVARLFSTPGEILVDFYFFSISKNGVHEGLLVCWRLLLIVWLGLLFVSSSHISQIKWAVEWFLSPLPMVPEKRISTMMGLVLRFIPVIFQKAHEVSQAQKARGSDYIKNPLTRIRRLILPMVRSVFQDADQVATAMAARCYTEKKHTTYPAFRRHDWLILFLGIMFSLAVFLV